MRQLERRHYERFKIKYGSIVVVNKSVLFKLKNRVIKVGPLFDISKGGLSVTYVEDKVAFDDIGRISLINSGSEVRKIDDLPIEVIRDVEIGRKADQSLRRRSMQFGTLTGYQKARLSYFLHLLNETETENDLLIANDQFYRF